MTDKKKPIATVSPGRPYVRGENPRQQGETTNRVARVANSRLDNAADVAGMRSARAASGANHSAFMEAMANLARNRREGREKKKTKK